jgi:hypothetical protein
MTDLLYCEQAQVLLEAFGETVHELTTLYQVQSQALIDGDQDFTRFDDLIRAANEHKHAAKSAYMLHMENHCCSTLAPLLKHRATGA